MICNICKKKDLNHVFMFKVSAFEFEDKVNLGEDSHIRLSLCEPCYYQTIMELTNIMHDKIKGAKDVSKH